MNKNRSLFLCTQKHYVYCSNVLPSKGYTELVKIQR